jgi:DNA-binding transcriptional ArsR family regulator
MDQLEKLGNTLDALGHPLRLKAVAALSKGDLYLAQIAEELEVSRALAKVHLMKLERAGLVESRVVLIENQAKALRYYRLKQFEVDINPETIKKMVDIAK